MEKGQERKEVRWNGERERGGERDSQIESEGKVT
jgi:hypothetical protein